MEAQLVIVALVTCCWSADSGGSGLSVRSHNLDPETRGARSSCHTLVGSLADCTARAPGETVRRPIFQEVWCLWLNQLHFTASRGSFFGCFFLGHGDGRTGMVSLIHTFFLAWRGSLCSSSTRSVSIIIIVAIFSGLECAGEV